MNEIKYFSMFSGVGGFELGLSNIPKTAGNKSRGNEEDSTSPESELLASKQFTCVGMSEFNKYSSQVLKYRFPNIKNWGDCTKIRPEDLPDFDMLCGGFPCQAFSIAGKRRGFEDTRGTMFFEVARILKVKRPKTILLENVKGLLNHNKGETFGVIIQTLDELGYEVQWMVLNSKFFGVPQNRERVLIIGSLRGESRPEILPFRCNDSETIGEGTVTRTFTAGGHSGGLHSDSTAIVRAVLTPDRINKRQNGRRFKEPEEPSFTCTGQDIHGICKTVRSGGRGSLSKKHEWDVINTGYSIRRLTPIECERLQGFPDNWTEFGINEQGERVKMSDTQRYKQMGNAVTTKVIQAVGEGLCSLSNGGMN